jgi:3-oxoacyl-[acyl-carrier protein] reductase
MERTTYAPAAIFELSGRVALVTGAQRGIGAEIARQLAGAGAEVVINYTVEPELAAGLAAEINGSGGKAWALEFDVTSSAAVTAGFETLLERSGRLDILVNNAGIRADGLALRMSDAQWREALAVNLDGALYCCRAALALMRKSGGSIVNISSIAAFAGSAGQANYAAAKAGLIGLSKSLAVEYASRNIRVNCVVPGLIETQMTQSLKQAYREKFLQQIPMGRFGEPQEVAATVLFLASDAASYITGAAIHVNGGGYLA